MYLLRADHVHEPEAADAGRPTTLPGTADVAGNSMHQLLTEAQQGRWAPLKEAAQHNPGFDDAPCTRVDPEFFFVAGDDPVGESPTMRQENRANLRKATDICARCPLATRAACLVSALEERDYYGVRGGVSAAARQQLHRGWHEQVDEENIATALQGRPVELTDGEHRRVVELYAEHPETFTVPAAAVARAIGISPGLLAWRVYKARQNNADSHRRPTALADSAA